MLNIRIGIVLKFCLAASTRANKISDRTQSSRVARDPIRLWRLIVLWSIDGPRAGFDADPRVHLSRANQPPRVSGRWVAQRTLAQREGTREKLERIPKYIYVGTRCCEETARHSRDGSSALNPDVTATRLPKTDDRLWATPILYQSFAKVTSRKRSWQFYSYCSSCNVLNV